MIPAVYVSVGSDARLSRAASLLDSPALHSPARISPFVADSPPSPVYSPASLSSCPSTVSSSVNLAALAAAEEFFSGYWSRDVHTQTSPAASPVAAFSGDYKMSMYF